MRSSGCFLGEATDRDHSRQSSGWLWIDLPCQCPFWRIVKTYSRSSFCNNYLHLYFVFYMKNRFDFWVLTGFYAIILVPLVLLIVFSAYFSPCVFIGLFLGYCLIYRPLTSSFRLLHFRLIDKSDFWKPFIPFWDKQFFKQLYLGILRKD